MRHNEFSGSFELKEPEEFFKLLHMYFNQVAADERDVNNTKTQLIKNIRNNQGEVNRFRDSVTKLKYNFNPLTVPFTEEFVNNITAKKLTDLYYKHFGNPDGYTFVFTGPMDATKGKALVEKYIASLNGDKIKTPALKYKESSFRKGEVSLRYKAKNMLSTKASVSRIYSGEIDYTAENSMMAKFITYILRDRYMKSIREEKGGTYHVGVTGDLSRMPENSVNFSIDFDTDPALVDELLEIVQLEIDKLVASGPTQKEMREIKLYLEKVYKDQTEDTAWLTLISDALRQIPDIATPAKKMVDKMDAGDIHTFAKKVFTTGNRMTFVFEPEL
jgi:zinc protease